MLQCLPDALVNGTNALVCERSARDNEGGTGVSDPSHRELSTVNTAL